MTLRTALLYLFGQADAIHRVAESKSSLWTGLALVLTAAIARSYDQVFFFERPMSFVEPILFSMSVAENLRLGAPGAGDEEVAGALELCRAEFVFDLPHGLDTRVGEQGLTLSGGQRQRLALARAVLGRPRVLVLDDPLSALDVHTEASVVRGLEGALRRTTALVVTHRPSTLALIDRVALLDGGVITATGTHADLLTAMPAYRAVVSDLGPAPAGFTVGGAGEAAVGSTLRER